MKGAWVYILAGFGCLLFVAAGIEIGMHNANPAEAVYWADVWPIALKMCGGTFFIGGALGMAGNS